MIFLKEKATSRFRYLCITLLLVSVISSCSVKFPAPTGTDTGLLVIPTEVLNYTTHDFAYYYEFEINPDPGEKIYLNPVTGKRLQISKELKPGTYSITGIMFHTVPSNSELFTTTNFGTNELEAPIVFTIEPNGITLLPYRMHVLNEYQSPNDTEYFVQSEELQQMTPADLREVVGDMGDIENLNLWKFDPEKYQ